MSFADFADTPFADPGLPVDERVADLLARMTIDEKLGQLGSAWVFQLADAEGATLDRYRVALELARRVRHWVVRPPSRRTAAGLFDGWWSLVLPVLRATTNAPA